MASQTNSTFGYKVVTATTNVCPRSCDVGGIFVSSATATPTITVYDSATTTTSDPVVSVFTPVAGTYYPIPASTESGLYIVISGTVSATVFFA